MRCERDYEIAISDCEGIWTDNETAFRFVAFRPEKGQLEFAD